MELTIQQILELEHKNEERLYIPFYDFSIFSPLSELDTDDMEIEVEKQLTERSYVWDNCNDGGARDVIVMLYQNKPFAIYQYIGKGYVSNEKIFDAEVFQQFLRDYVAEYLSKKVISEVGKEQSYTIRNYNLAEFVVEDNKLISKVIVSE